MKYSKPSLRNLNNNNEMYCGNGTGASTTGCTEGVLVFSFCALGSSNINCTDGNSASNCAFGSGATGFYSRCQSGTSPS